MLTFIGQKITNAVLLFGGGAIKNVQTLVGAEPVGRALDAAETAELKKIFADALNYELIRLKIGSVGIFSLGGAPFTHCNTVYISDGYLPPETEDHYQPAFNQLLAHEVTHVWQYQHGGANYMSASLWHQFAGWRATGSRGAAYDFHGDIKAEKSWAQLNPEQQARLIEIAYAAGFFDDEQRPFIYYDDDLTDFLRRAVEQLRAGAGAP